MDYQYLKARGWLNEASGEEGAGHPPPPARPAARAQAHARAEQTLMTGGHATPDVDDMATYSGTLAGPALGLEMARPLYDPARTPDARVNASGIDTTHGTKKGRGMFLYTVEEGQRVLMRRPNGSMEVVVGPNRVWRGSNGFSPMLHYVAHPGDFLMVRFRDGHQEHLAGPAEVWFDPRVHQEVKTQEGLQLAAKEAVVAYSAKDGDGQVQRRVVYGPALFVPQPGEWLHTFSWHSSRGGSKGVVKVPNGLVFQKLWMMPDQMYHDVADVRTADDAVLTVRLMIFFELVDINTMLDATHDPIGDFVNAASSDVVDFVGRHDFASFKRHTDQLNELPAYKQLTGRASQCGYRINKVVYRGYGAPDRLQQMQDQAIEARTKLQLERETERQSQEVRDSKLENRVQRAAKVREERGRQVDHEITLERTRLLSEMETDKVRSERRREERRLSAEQAAARASQNDGRRREHFAGLRDMGVDLTALLTRGRPDRVIELRGHNGDAHVHVDGPGKDLP